MKTVGIIAEYNPFHNGHAYQLAKAKELSGADFCVVIMSGNFTQRGTPAIADKYLRTQMALSCGADLVIELPVCFATGSAEYFAYGAVSVLNALQVDALCFGSECGDIACLKSAAEILYQEPSGFRTLLQKHLKSGRSYPLARSLAISEQVSADIPSTLLQTPNNILGVEYLKALYRLNSSMEVYTVKREGMGYTDETVSDTVFSSAAAIRKHLDCPDALTASMPKAALAFFNNYLATTSPVVMDDFSSMLYYKLLSLQQEGYTAYLDVTDAISDKICNSLDSYSNITSFAESVLKTKELTLTRLNRCLLHILLNIKKEHMQEYTGNPGSLYARILGFRKSSEAIFKQLASPQIPFISKLADAKSILPATAMQMLRQDIFAAHLYEGVLAQKNGGFTQNEYRRKLIILP